MFSSEQQDCVQRYEWVTPNVLELELSTNRLRLYFLEEGVVRCRYVTGAVFENIPSYGISSDYRPNPPKLEVDVREECIEIRSQRLTLKVRKSDGGLELLDKASGRELCADAEGMGHRFHERTGDELVWVLKKMPKNAYFFGLGDKSCELNLRGKRFEMWGSDHYQYHPNSDPLYKSIPFFLCLDRGKQYGVFFDNTMRSYFDFGKERPDRLLFGADGGVMDYYFIVGNTPVNTIEIYTRMTGLPPLPPLWSLGYHQSKWSYYPEKMVRDLADEFRARRIPCDGIHLDIHHMNGYQSLTWNRERFPDPPGMISRLAEKGFKVVTIVNPGIKINPDNYVWRSGYEKNVFCRRHDGALLEGEVWPGTCTFPDFTSPTTRSWWAKLFKRQVREYGVRGIWVDMNEPAIFPDKTFPDDTRHAFEGYSCSHLKAHNIYGQCMAQATRMGMLQNAPHRRPFVLSRAGFAGLQRWAATWTGDNDADWENLKMANLMIQRLSTSGVSFCGADTGGFLGHPTPELFARWMQMAAFHVFYRNHSNGQFGGQEPWCFGKNVEDVVRLAIEERYRLLPYLYTQFYRYSSEGTPIIRSLALMHPENENVYWRSSEFFLGDAIYVAPVHHPGQGGRNVYIPKGHWFSLWTDQEMAGEDGEMWANSPMNRIPVMVKGGMIIPRWPVQQYVGEISNPNYTYDLWWAPRAQEQSLLYEDDGDGASHRVGDYLLHSFSYTAENRGFALEHSEQGGKKTQNSMVTLAVHALPKSSNPRLLLNGLPIFGAFDERHVFRADIPSNFQRIELEF